jgi:hypothetical protein
MPKIYPEKTYVVIYTNREQENSIEEGENMENKKNKTKGMDIDGDGDVDFKDMLLFAKSKIKFISYLYDVSIDNIPWGAILSLIITVIASSIILTNLSSCQQTVEKYFSMSTFSNYLTTSLVGIILLQIAVLLHGISVCILESSRECCKVKQIGCRCKQYSKKCLTKCLCCQKITRIGCQSFWGIFGTLLLLITYFFSLAQICISVISTLSSYLFTQSCNSFSNIIKNLIDNGYQYIAEAKVYLQQGDQIALDFLTKYHEFINLQETFTNSAMGQLNQVSTPTVVDNPKPEITIWKKESSFGRQLAANDFNPELEIAKGRSFISVLNQTILETESQLIYYESQFEKVKEVCFDYSSMYDNFYYIMIGCLMIAFSQLIIFAVHNKYFTIWNYEVKLINNRIYS